jgi:hypothetical protein
MPIAKTKLNNSALLTVKFSNATVAEAKLNDSALLKVKLNNTA